ncbi:MAG: hypothetical protein LBS27_11225 [Bifidobacteriaceae bacterium]|nr:hypothetical protein [Bifidobacteriaceae bacterium]
MTGRPLGALLGGAALISALTVAARAAGFARWAVFAPAVGSTAIGSAYTAANALPNVLFEVAAGGALAGLVVPLAAGPLARKAAGEVNAIASALMTWTLTVLVPLAAVLALAAGPIARAILGGAVESAHPGSQAAAAQLLVMFAPQVPLYGIGVVAAGLLQAGKRFFWPALAPLASSVAVIAVYAVFAGLAGGRQDSPLTLSGGALAWLGWGTTAGVAVLTLPLLAPLRRQGVRWRWSYRWPEGLGRRALALAGSGLGALAAQQLCVVAVVLLANRRGGTGTLPLYHYAQAVYMLPYAVLALPLATAAFPYLAQAASGDDPTRLRCLSSRTSRLVLAAGLAGAAALMAAAPAVQRVFAAIDRSGGAAGLAGAVVWFAPGLAGFALLTHLQRLLYSAGQARAGGIAVAVGWLSAVAACVTWVTIVTSDHPDSVATLRALGGGSSLGMVVGALVAVAAVGRSLGAGMLAGLGRTALLGGAGAAIGALFGNRLAGAVADSATWSALAVGIAAALIAAAVVAVLALSDSGLRDDLKWLKGLER